MSAYSDVRKRLVEQVANDDQRLPCMFCHAPTLRETLTQYGARCHRCFEAYLVAALPPARNIGDRADPRSWAKALKERHDAGERLTFAQRDMYRAVLRRDQPGEAA